MRLPTTTWLSRRGNWSPRSANVSDGQDWRLLAELEEPEDHQGLLDRVVHHAHGGYGKAADEADAEVGPDVAITHDGIAVRLRRLPVGARFGTRESIAAACDHHGLTASYVVGHWDDDLNRWRQVDPPETAEQAEQTRTQELADETVGNTDRGRSAGNTVRASLEQGLREYADRLGLECEVGGAPPRAPDPGRLQGHRATAQDRRVSLGSSSRDCGRRSEPTASARA